MWRGAELRLPFLLDETRWQIQQRKNCWESKPTSPSLGHEALPVGSSSAFFKATGAWGNGSWAFACPHLPFSCQQPWPRSHFSDGPVNESVTLVEKQESGVNNKRANCAPHLPWKWLSSKELSLHKANSPPPENMERCLLNGFCRGISVQYISVHMSCSYNCDSKKPDLVSI